MRHNIDSLRVYASVRGDDGNNVQRSEQSLESSAAWARRYNRPGCPQATSLCPSGDCFKHRSAPGWRRLESRDRLYFIYHLLSRFRIKMIQKSSVHLAKEWTKYCVTRASYPIFVLLFILRFKIMNVLINCLQYYNVIFLLPQKADFQNRYTYIFQRYSHSNVCLKGSSK